MIIDELDPNTVWATHTQADGSNIGGVPPQAFSIAPLPGTRPDWLLSTVGNSGKVGDYPAWMAYPKVPRQRLGSRLKLSFYLTMGGILAGMNVIETDIILVSSGYKYNGSAQYNLSRGFQIADAHGSWVDTGIAPPPYAPAVNVRHYFELNYTFDYLNNLLSVTSIGIDSGLPFPVPAVLQNIPAQPSTWLPGVYLQLQMGSTPSAQAWQARFKKIRLSWS